MCENILTLTLVGGQQPECFYPPRLRRLYLALAFLAAAFEGVQWGILPNAAVLHSVSAFYCHPDTPWHHTRLSSDEAQLKCVGGRRRSLTFKISSWQKNHKADFLRGSSSRCFCQKKLNITITVMATNLYLGRLGQWSVSTFKMWFSFLSVSCG